MPVQESVVYLILVTDELSSTSTSGGENRESDEMAKARIETPQVGSNPMQLAQLDLKVLLKMGVDSLARLRARSALQEDAPFG